MRGYDPEAGDLPWQVLYRPLAPESMTIWAKTAEEAREIFKRDDFYDSFEVDSVEGPDVL